MRLKAMTTKLTDRTAHFIHLSDRDDAALRDLLRHARILKQDDFREPVAAGKTIGLIFLNPSLRTRISFETAAFHLGAGTSIIQPGQGVWTFETRTGVVMDGDRTEHLKEAVQVISRYVDLIGVRAFAGMKDLDEDLEDRLLEDIVRYATVPVINMESAREHPCQALADGLTMMERFDGRPEGRKFVLSWAPHPKPLPMAVPNSALEIAARLGMEVTLACPPEMKLPDAVLDHVDAHASRNRGGLSVVHDQAEAFRGADIIYGKSWAAPLVYRDPEAENELRTTAYGNWTIDTKTMSLTNQAAFMHCLPVRRNVVVTDKVLDGPDAIHVDQAENRLHAQKAVLMKLMGLNP
jgi:N-acetylornithine carbamoyltransferase